MCLLTYALCTKGKNKCPAQLEGKVVIVTGGNAGIGFETAKDLAGRGARVILACRNEGRGTAARDKIIAATSNADVHYRKLDLASLDSVRAFASDILDNEQRLDILINNAGMVGDDFIKTEDGLLLLMQTNHFGPFLLTNLLLPLLKQSAPSRIIVVSSSAHQGGNVDFENLNGEKETAKSYSSWKFYSMSKLCNNLMTIELDRQLKGTGVTVNSLHPGVVKTELVNQFWLWKPIMPVAKYYFKSLKEGAQTSIYLAVTPELEKTSGKYFVDCHEATASKLSRNMDLARKLWQVSERIVKLSEV